MKLFCKQVLWGLMLGCFSLTVRAQEVSVGSARELGDDSLKGWHLLDKQKDGFNGISLGQAYQELQKTGKKHNTVVVAVIDSGIDTTHEDLKTVLWTNPGEIPGNGIDDDHDGYVDDVHGWNFLGGKDGRNVVKDSYEGARIYHQLKAKYADSTAIDTTTDEKKWEYQEWVKVKSRLEADAANASMTVLALKHLYQNIPTADSVMRETLGKQEYTGNDLQAYAPTTAGLSRAKNVMMALFKGFDEMNALNKTLIQNFNDYYEGQSEKADELDKAPEDYRGEVVKDNYADFNDRYYGNNDLMGNAIFHGTHVAGIIAADRTNHIGIDGICDDVKIMMVRVVDDGDEHDKDIALGIRYAVDHGAKVINMSFGKSFSPQKAWVDEAVKYAASKDVLLVHAAGNDHENVDSTDNFPTPDYIDGNETAPNWITVGASGDDRIGGLVAGFSNYGKRSVNVFAPGVKIYSTVLNNGYDFADGTSMASPVVAGVAALIREYFPSLNAEQVKYVIEKSAIAPAEQVTIPGTETQTSLSELCTSGGIVNAYAAIKLAETLKGENKIPRTHIKRNKKD
ncbi:S8 family serine peptidase [Dinghuibacter silviterrae]|uniref:Subtilase family protein n=1 Tax=Dinghuibacter silviterrae TaxID=1539049 RepID=A0A4R8DIB4_9BACT|nr:S8 family serine peptidase [Dinghuibacter silviterrae]TDW97228.1 subtilase family protein [Dinghuibacter silviterrae]